jgi:serine/threonine protein kinase
VESSKKQGVCRRRKRIRGEVGHVVVGSLVLNRFLIERRIGSGGFGTVYEAWDGRLERSVAVKAIEEVGGRGSQRVLREAQAAARLNHPGIVTLYEMGEEDGNALLVTELVEGSTLAQLNRQGTLSDREIGEIGADLCEALDHAHCRAVVHRDIKPQNVLVTEEGEPRAKLMDFGVARLTDAAALTAPGDVVGTLAYMSPEQAEGRAAGPEADVYSLALMLYECWAGENPNRRGTPAATARAIGARLRPLRRARPDLPRELADTVDACLQRRPDRRPPLEQLGEAIEGSLDRLADHPSRGYRGARIRLAAAAAAAVLGLWLAAGHGALLP